MKELSVASEDFKPPLNLPEFFERKHFLHSVSLSGSLISPFLCSVWISLLYFLLVTWRCVLRPLAPCALDGVSSLSHGLVIQPSR